MKIVIAGAGKVGYYLVKTLLPYKHKIIVIETQRELCEKIANELNINTVNGDATSIEHLTEAYVDEADVFIALTGRDQENLISCQLAKKNFGVKRTIARVNNPKNISVFEKLGVDKAVSSTSIIADFIEQEVDFSGMKTLIELKEGKIALSELTITKTSPVIGTALKDLEMPTECLIITMIRNDAVLIPSGTTVLLEGDYIIITSSVSDKQELKHFFLGK
ncbi:MAG: TrkA-N domain protein [Herbinix sp.]|jgi:trk system potassium uptake protein TrkA|nr:TrkA-N domain protein [Herbinix sp.]